MEGFFKFIFIGSSPLAQTKPAARASRANGARETARATDGWLSGERFQLKGGMLTLFHIPSKDGLPSALRPERRKAGEPTALSSWPERKSRQFPIILGAKNLPVKATGPASPVAARRKLFIPYRFGQKSGEFLTSENPVGYWTRAVFGIEVCFFRGEKRMAEIPPETLAPDRM